MGLIVSITLVLGLIFYWEGRRLYKETEEHSKLQRIAITIIDPIIPYSPKYSCIKVGVVSSMEG